LRSFFLRTCAPAMAFGDRFVISSERLGTPVISETAWCLEAVFLLGIVTSLLATGGCAFRDGGGVLTKLMGLRGRLFEGRLSKKTELADKFHVRTLSDFQVHTILLLVMRLTRRHLFQIISENYNFCRSGYILMT
jgi:hypothetical protein